MSSAREDPTLMTFDESSYQLFLKLKFDHVTFLPKNPSKVPHLLQDKVKPPHHTIQGLSKPNSVNLSILFWFSVCAPNTPRCLYILPSTPLKPFVPFVPY